MKLPEIFNNLTWLDWVLIIAFVALVALPGAILLPAEWLGNRGGGSAWADLPCQTQARQTSKSGTRQVTKRLIVNADDYGHSPGICLGIREAHLEGIVTSTTAMMNRPLAPAELTVAARTCPNLGVGVHLVLTAGKPVLAAEKVASLGRQPGQVSKIDRIRGTH